MSRPDIHEALMVTAFIWAQRGTCPRKQVGCVIAKDTRIIMTGYNGAPAGLPHCEHNDNKPCQTASHAEINAFGCAARFGLSTKGATLYTTLSPCIMCAMTAINAGIEKVFYCDPYRDLSGVAVLEQAGINVIRWR